MVKATSIAQRLVREGLVSQPDLARAEHQAAQRGTTVYRALLGLGLVAERDAQELVADQLGLPILTHTQDFHIDEGMFEFLTSPYLKKNRVLPVVSQEFGRRLLLADPSDQDLVQELAVLTGNVPSLAVSSEGAIRSAIEAHKSPLPGEDKGKRIDFDEARIVDQAKLGPYIEEVSHLFERAVADGASDVHFELENGELVVRQRVHGVLMMSSIDTSLQGTSVLARVKVMAGMNVTERRLPQDGRIGTTVAGRTIDIRVSAIPTDRGESVVCRILDPENAIQNWGELGFDEGTASRIIELIERPNGLFLVTGPTGSGKTTTLYAALNHLRSAEKKIVTIEDPVEYQLAGLQQIAVRENIGFSFGVALRSVLRHDPNILMVGEIRDEETAELAVRAALVGRLVLSTLHVNEPSMASLRLHDLGVPDFLAKEVLIGALGQTLVPEATGRKLHYNLWTPK